MIAGRMPRQALEYRLGEKRPKDQPRYRWEEQDKKNVEKEELNGWKWWKRRHGMTKTDGGFRLKLDPRQ